MKKIIASQVVMFDYDETIVTKHLHSIIGMFINQNSLASIQKKEELTVFDHSSNEIIENMPLLNYAKLLRNESKILFNENVMEKLLEALNDDNKKVAIVTKNAYPDVAYQLLVDELVNKYSVSLNQIHDQLKVIGGVVHSHIGKMGHVLTALVAFNAIETDNLSKDNFTEIFNDVYLYENDKHNLEVASFYGMHPILIENNGDLNEKPVLSSAFIRDYGSADLWELLHPEDIDLIGNPPPSPEYDNDIS